MALFNAVPFAFYVESYRAMQQQFAPSFQQILDKIHSQLNSYSGDLLAHENAHLSPKNVKDKKSVLRIAVALSGGLDSTVLLHACNQFIQNYNQAAENGGAINHNYHYSSISIMALHVHHGISPNADNWLAHCEQQCQDLHIPFDAKNVQINAQEADGIEAAARQKRYAALGEMCERHHIDALITAHHQDDQAETLLLQLLRGAGIAGLGGMQTCHFAAGLLGTKCVLLVRPLLDFSRVQLEKYAQQFQLNHIEDESNADVRYTRNALRLQIMPLLAQHFPGYQSRFTRTTKHAQSALNLLSQFAQQDYQQVALKAAITPVPSARLDIQKLAQLSDERIDNVLRYWIALQQMAMPSSARLAEMRKQLLTARDDAQVSIKHEHFELYRYRNALSLARCFTVPTEPQTFVWTGQSQIDFPHFSGALHFTPSHNNQFGVKRSWLLKQTCQLRPRQGGERLKLAPNRPNRDVKSHYQALGIAYWERERLPFVWIENQLFFAAGIGINGVYQVDDNQEEPLINLHWQSE